MSIFPKGTGGGFRIFDSSSLGRFGPLRSRVPSFPDPAVVGKPPGVGIDSELDSGAHFGRIAPCDCIHQLSK